MCLTIPDEKKAQLIPAYSPHARFVLTEPHLLKSISPYLSKAPIHPQLAGLYIISKGRVFRGIETHLKMLTKHDPDNRDSIVAEVYKDLFDIDLDDEVVDHVLLGKAYMREWFDYSLAKRSLDGTVTAAYKQYSTTGKNVFHYKLDYNERSLSHVNRGLAFVKMVIPGTASKMKEDDVYSGCVYADQFGIGPSTGLVNGSANPYRWIPPDSIIDGLQGDPPLPCRVVKCMDHIFEINVRTSEIAGLGAFLTVRPVHQLQPKNGSMFCLEAGSLIDLGVYAPLRAGDLIPDEVAITKNFVTGGKVEVYSFECRVVHGHALDITEARTGELHEEARRSVLTFVNEISDPEREAPTIHIEADPSGSIHYLLGSFKSEIQIPLGEEIELKVDYGVKYENIRVRHGYPRVKGPALQQKKKEVAEEAVTSLTDILMWEDEEVGRCIDFFVSNWEDCPGSALATPAECLERLLLVMVLLHARMKWYVTYSQTDRIAECQQAVARSKQLVESILDAFTPSSYRSLLESDLSRVALGLLFRDLDDAALRELPPCKLSFRLRNL
jgi:hypothetical protein